MVDALICGEGRDEVGVLLWLNPIGCAATIGVQGSVVELALDPSVLGWIRDRIVTGAAGDAGSAVRIARFAVLTDPPDADAGEVSEKATINQSIALRRRAADVERLYAGGAGVCVLD